MKSQGFQWAALAGAAVVLPLLALAPAQAQDSKATECAMPSAQAPTPPDTGPNSGTQPGSSGSTGWTGGTGGSHTGTTPGAPTSASPNVHPPVVQGVNPSVVAPVRKEC